MKTKKYDGADLRRILIAMVTNQTVCSRVATQWTAEGLFGNRWADLVGGWCVKHLRKYQTLPNGQLTSIFEDWAQSTVADDKTVEAVELFLRTMSDESEHVQNDSTEYLLDLAGKFFNKVRIEKEMELKNFPARSRRYSVES